MNRAYHALGGVSQLDCRCAGAVKRAHHLIVKPSVEAKRSPVRLLVVRPQADVAVCCGFRPTGYRLARDLRHGAAISVRLEQIRKRRYFFSSAIMWEFSSSCERLVKLDADPGRLPAWAPIARPGYR